VKPENRNPTRKERREIKKERKRETARKQFARRRLRRAALWSSVLIGLLVLVLTIAKLASTPPKSDLPAFPTSVEITPSDWIKGPRSSAVVLIEYSDFQCPACRNAEPMIRDMQNEFGDRVLFAYRHFPLRQHMFAGLAARAAEAAGRQDKFWEMHDLLFEGQERWSIQGHPEETFIEYARKLGLDVGRFRSDMASQESVAAVQEDVRTGTRAGVDHTPSFFLNGEMIRNPRNRDEFKNVLNQALRNKPQ
jgi:protein-disulfide isomerase